MRTFEARYSGACGNCDTRIRVGDLVGYVDDELVHETCEAAVPDLDERRPVCPECFIELPLSGVCACGGAL